MITKQTFQSHNGNMLHKLIMVPEANCSCSAFQQKNTLVTKVVNQRRLNHFMTFPETSLFNI